MTDKITLSNAQRVALRKEIYAQSRAGKTADELRTLRITLNNAGKSVLLDRAAELGIDVARAIAGVSTDNTDTVPVYDDANYAGDDNSSIGEDADVSTDVETQAQQTVQELDDLWRAMDVSTYRTRIIDLARKAHKPAVVIDRVVDRIVEVTRQAGQARPQAPHVGAELAHKVFGIGGTLGNLMLPVYAAPDAPAMDKHYIWPADMDVIVSALFSQGKAAWLAGPAGVGKTELAKQIASRLGRPFSRISCTNTTDASTLVGMSIPQWQDGQLAAAIRREGCVILIDEPSVARDGALYVFQSVMDESRAIYVDETGEVIPVARDVVFLIADNTQGQGDISGQYAGTRQVSRALLDRPAVMVTIDYLAPDVEARLLCNKAGVKRATADMLVAYANVTRAQTAAGDLPAAIGFRRLHAWAKLILDGITPSRAAHVAFINAAAPDAQEPLRQLLITHCDDSAISATL